MAEVQPLQYSEDVHEPALGSAVALDIVLGMPEAAMASEQLNVADGAANACRPPRSERDEGAPSRMRRATLQAQLGVESLEPVDDAARAQSLATFRLDDVAFTTCLAAELHESLAQAGMQRDHSPRTLLGDVISQRDLAANVAASVEHHRPGEARDLSGPQARLG